jgi:hypothetical protein
MGGNMSSILTELNKVQGRFVVQNIVFLGILQKGSFIGIFSYLDDSFWGLRE